MLELAMKNHFVPYNPKLKARARELRSNMTVGEKALWQRLRKKQIMGYDFDRQKPMDQFIVDFYCKALALAIEVDGSVHDSPEAKLRDQERQARLEQLGVRFLRFSDDAVRQAAQQPPKKSQPAIHLTEQPKIQPSQPTFTPLGRGRGWVNHSFYQLTYLQFVISNLYSI